PTFHYLHDGLHHAWIIEIEIWLMGKEAVPVVGLRFLAPGPVRFLGGGGNDAGDKIFLIRVAPDIPVTGARASRASLGAFEPRVLIGGMVDDQFGDDAQPAALGFLHEAAEVTHCAEGGVNIAVV